MTNLENNLIDIQTSKEISTLFKDFLSIIDELHLSKNIDDNQYTLLRKRILDKGNDCARNIQYFLSFFDFQINAQRVSEEAKNKRVIVKKFISSPAVMLE